MTEAEAVFPNTDRINEVIADLQIAMAKLTPEEALLLLVTTMNHAYDQVTEPRVAMRAADYLDGLAARIRLMHAPAQGNA
ncbi:MAG: hypothetical protein H6988_11575 [Pseudomonadales bacterium]|nr:hypothetical protein [Pseudomonadales bacterium]